MSKPVVIAMVNQKGGTGKKQEEKRDLLGNIIDKINLMYAGNFTEADRVIVETIFDKFKTEGKTLKKQAKNSGTNIKILFHTSLITHCHNTSEYYNEKR